jgi:putative endonuclease
MTEQWRVYICKVKTGRFYTGISINPRQRLARHNAKEGAQFARDQGPFELVYISAPFSSKSEARQREQQIKGWVHSKKEKLISGEWV